MSPLAIISAVIFGVHHASNDDSSGYPATGFLAKQSSDKLNCNALSPFIDVMTYSYASLTCTLLQTFAFWISVRHIWQALTGFRGIQELNGPKFFQLPRYFML
jgi:hypothetical protein